MELPADLKNDLNWLASNWEKKGIASLSAYNQNFFRALKNILRGCASEYDIALVAQGTEGRAADGYAHMLEIDSDELASDAWIALRRLGNISKGLRKLGLK